MRLKEFGRQTATVQEAQVVPKETVTGLEVERHAGLFSDALDEFEGFGLDVAQIGDTGASVCCWRSN